MKGFFPWLKEGVNVHIFIWLLLTLLLLIVNGLFYINDFISSPQHGIFEHFDAVSRVIKDERKEIWYRLYFVLDFFWAANLLMIIGLLAKDENGNSLLKFRKPWTWSALTFTGIALIAFLIDAFEGISYLIYWKTPFPLLWYAKLGSYAIVGCFFLYWLLRRYILPKFKSGIRFVRTSILSLIFILVVYLLITVMPQGGTLIVDLFYNPWNILLFFFLFTFLAVIISHYPAYVDIWLYGDTSCVRLEMHPEGKILGFGIIYYNTLPGDRGKAYDSNFSKMMRRTLGIFLYVAVFKILLDLIPRFFEVYFDVNTVTFFILIAALIMCYSFGKYYIEWKKDLKSSTSSEETKKKAILQISKYVKFFPGYFFFCTGMVLATTIIIAVFNWSRISLIFFLITLTLEMFLYILFKITRTYFKYVYYSEELYQSNKEMFDKDIKSLFLKFAPAPTASRKGYRRYFAAFSDNIVYLNRMRISGFICLLILLLVNISFAFSSFINPINIILLYIIVFYSFIIILFKHVLFYHRRNEKGNFFRYWIPLLAVVFVGLGVFLTSLPNDLHQLKIIQRSQPQMDYRSYMDYMTFSGPVNESQNFFFIGSYGGGLKANLWNLLLLHELEKQNGTRFLDRTLVMSGVSGGAVGLGNYSSLIYEQENNSTAIINRIHNIGRSNVLSNELAYLLGYDWLREHMPLILVEHNGKDRSYKSMKVHAFNTGMRDSYNNVAFSDYWNAIRNSRNGLFPALIINTTAVGGRQGIASSVKFPDSTFAGADLITEFDGENTGKTLTYFGAISTTNRFPFFSPTAKIPDKGSYLDGGYFENSGLLSALEVYDAIAGNSSKPYHKQVNPVFINIINSEDFYIDQKIKEWKIQVEEPEEAGEISSIIGTVASIDKLPRYIQEKIKMRGFTMEPVMMPHKLSYGKVKAVLKAEVQDPLALMYKIEAHNDTIDRALKEYKKYDYDRWGVVQPPLARLLSEPAVYYQEAMVNHHPDVQYALKRIGNYLKTETEVNRAYQDSLKLQPGYGHREVSRYIDEKKE